MATKKVVLLSIPHSTYCEAARWTLQAAGVAFTELDYLLGVDNRIYPTVVTHARSLDTNLLSRLSKSIPVGGLEGRSDDVNNERKATQMVPCAIASSSKNVLGDSFEIANYAAANSNKKLKPLMIDQVTMDIYGAACRQLTYRYIAKSTTLTHDQQAKLGLDFYCCIGDEKFYNEQFEFYDGFIDQFNTLLIRAFNADDDAVLKKTMDIINNMFEYVEKELSDGRKFLGGDQLSVDDIMLAAHGSWLVFPETFGQGICTRFPSIEQMPDEYLGICKSFASTVAGQHIIKLYENHRDFKSTPVDIMYRPDPTDAIDFCNEIFNSGGRL